MKSSGASLIACALLAGCASSSPDSAADRGHVVIGSGSAQDRQDIEASNQQMFQTEQAGIAPVSAPIAPAPTPAAPPTKTP